MGTCRSSSLCASSLWAASLWLSVLVIFGLGARLPTRGDVVSPYNRSVRSGFLNFDGQRRDPDTSADGVAHENDELASPFAGEDRRRVLV